MARACELESDSESSYSESCSTSCSDTDGCPFYAWMEKINGKGNLFYIDISVPNSAEEKNINDFLLSNGNNEYFRETRKKLNSAQKLKLWMKRRKRKKTFPLQENAFETLSNEDSFESCMSYTKNIFVEVDRRRQTLGRRTTLSEEVLGLKFQPVEEGVTQSRELKIVACSENIHDVEIGEYLLCVNDREVNANNIDDVLSSLPLSSKVKLTVSNNSRKTCTCSDDLSNDFTHGLLQGTTFIQEAKQQLLKVAHAVYCFDISEDALASEGGVRYRYPSEETPFFQLKGLFITLSHIIPQVASAPLLSCSLAMKDELVHVGFVQEQSDVFVLMMPSSFVTVTEIHHFAADIVKYLKLRFSSLKIAFSEINKSETDDFFTLFFTRYLLPCGQKANNDSYFISILPCVQWLPLPMDIKIEVDDILSELESSDYGCDSEGFIENQRLFSILGSCLFYKGFLLCSHFQKQDLLDINTLLQHEHVLLMTKMQNIAELIIWREIFPTRYKEPKLCDSGFNEVTGRYVVLIVAMQHSVLAVLLESGGCAKSIGSEKQIPPETFYVEEVENTLIILHEAGIIQSIEKILAQCVPSVVLPDSITKDKSASQSNCSTSFGDSNNRMYYQNTNEFTEKGAADVESEIESSFSDTSNESFSHFKRFGSFQSSEHRSWDKLSGVKEETHLSKDPIRILSNDETVLLQYLHMDPIEGVFLAPVNINCHSTDSSFIKILNKFHESCLRMRVAFTRSLRNEALMKTLTVTKYGVNGVFHKAYEQGMMFQRKSKEDSKSSVLRFWVIGRLFFTPEPRELYVCIHDSLPQDIVEIAFRIGFGVSL